MKIDTSGPIFAFLIFISTSFAKVVCFFYIKVMSYLEHCMKSSLLTRIGVRIGVIY